MKNFLKSAAVSVACAAIVLCSSATVAFAASVPVTKVPVTLPSEKGATVSLQEDTADNNDPTMGTEFWMYIAPDPEVIVNKLPKMGDEGPDFITLVATAFGVGVAYLGCKAYAESGADKSSARTKKHTKAAAQ